MLNYLIKITKKELISNNMTKILKEALHIPGAACLGTGHGFDLFKITTWEGAQSFIVDGNQDRLAGDAYMQNQGTFEANINEQQQLFFFTRQNTNNVIGAVLKNGDWENIRFVASNGSYVNVRCNFQYEQIGGYSNNNVIDSSNPLPFYLIPEATFENQLTDERFKGLYIHNNELQAVLTHFSEYTTLSLIDIPETITSISSDAFNFGVSITSIILGNQIEHVDNHAMDNVLNNISVTKAREDIQWPANWNAGKESITNYHTDKKAAIRSAWEQQKLKLEKEREEKTKLQAQNLRYQIKGKEVVILGLRKPTTSVIIPESIEGKPVAVISAFAFFEEDELMSIQLPSTLKIIERYAFEGTSIKGIINIPRNCIVSKGNSDVMFAKTL